MRADVYIEISLRTRSVQASPKSFPFPHLSLLPPLPYHRSPERKTATSVFYGPGTSRGSLGCRLAFLTIRSGTKRVNANISLQISDRQAGALVRTWDPRDSSEMRCGYGMDGLCAISLFTRSRVRVTGKAVLFCDSQEFTRFISFQKGDFRRRERSVCR